jgi:hypothetical protein
MSTSTQPNACREAINECNAKARAHPATGNGWGPRHADAFMCPGTVERPTVNLILALAQYADAYALRFEDTISTDGYGAPIWLSMLKGWRDLLNFELGKLDGGTLDGMAYAVARAAGFTDAEVEA